MLWLLSTLCAPGFAAEGDEAEWWVVDSVGRVGTQLLETGDFDGDGQLDVVLDAGASDIIHMKVTGLTTGQWLGTEVGLGDIDDDGQVDLLASSGGLTNGPIHVFDASLPGSLIPDDALTTIVAEAGSVAWGSRHRSAPAGPAAAQTAWTWV